VGAPLTLAVRSFRPRIATRRIKPTPTVPTNKRPRITQSADDEPLFPASFAALAAACGSGW